MKPPRDPARIDGVLAKVREVWVKHPDLRLCQLLGNCRPDDVPLGAFYYMEDDVLVRELDAVYRAT